MSINVLQQTNPDKIGLNNLRFKKLIFKIKLTCNTLIRPTVVNEIKVAMAAPKIPQIGISQIFSPKFNTVLD